MSIQNLKSLYKAYLVNGYGSLWVGGLVEINHHLEGWCYNVVSRSHKVRLWKHIKRSWDIYVSKRHFTVGNGKNVKFWHDILCGDKALKETYPQVFSLARLKEVLIADLVFLIRMSQLLEMYKIRKLIFSWHFLTLCIPLICWGK